MKLAIKDMEIFYLTYDEPFKEERWNQIRELIPSAKRVDGVKGFDRAHKTCAEECKSSRLLVIDGDNTLLPQFFSERISLFHCFKDHVISWSAVNSINGLEYGNGGVKSWKREVILNMNTHEASKSVKSISDFCFEIPYFQLPNRLSVTHINLTPFQAFRSGFREGIKMALIRGEVPTGDLFLCGLTESIPRNNLFRLMIWMSVGADVPNGLWAILGARLGLFKLILERTRSVEYLHDYAWFDEYWRSEIAPKYSGSDLTCRVTNYSWDTAKLVSEIENLGQIIREATGLEIPLHSPQKSKVEKFQLKNPHREGYLLSV